MPVTLQDDQKVTYSYTETDAKGNQVPNQGTPTWSVSDGSIITDVDNGDGTVTISAVALGTASLSLIVTLPDGSQLPSVSDDITVEAGLPVAASLVAGAPEAQ